MQWALELDRIRKRQLIKKKRAMPLRTTSNSNLEEALKFGREFEFEFGRVFEFEIWKGIRNL